MPPNLLSFPVRCGLALVSGVVYSAAYPPLGWRWAVLLGVMGLLVALWGQTGTRARTLGFIHGISAFAVSLSWLFHVFGWVAVVLFGVLAAFTALFAEMQSRAVSRGISGWMLAIFTAVNWSGWEFIRAEIFPLKFPWMTAGLALGPNGLLPWIGVYGVSFIVILCVALIMTEKWPVALASLAAFIALLYVKPESRQIEMNDPLAVKVGGLQMENVSLTEFLTETRKLSPEVRYVLWPEYAVPYDLRANRRDWELVQNLCREQNITLTLGTQSRPGNGDEWRNIALTLDPNGFRGEHNKVHTVHLFDDGIAGTTALPVVTDHGKVGTPVCFDCDYEGVVRKMTAAGAEMFLVPIMDAESWTEKQHDQHAELFRIRACENGRWMFVCGTSGVSQIISPVGKVVAVRRALDQGPLSGMLKRETTLTFYTRFGWMFPWGVLGAAVLCWLWMMVPVRGSKSEFTQPLRT